MDREEEYETLAIGKTSGASSYNDKSHLKKSAKVGDCMLEQREFDIRNHQTPCELDKDGMLHFIQQPRSIPAMEFESDNDIVSVSIPGTVQVVGERAFSACKHLKTIEIDNGVEIIGDFAFSWSSIEKIVIPRSVVSIGECAFSASPFLRVVRIEGHPTLGSMAFGDCPKLKSVFIAGHCDDIDLDAFNKTPQSWVKNDPISFYSLDGTLIWEKAF